MFHTGKARDGNKPRRCGLEISMEKLPDVSPFTCSHDHQSRNGRQYNALDGPFSSGQVRMRSQYMYS